LNDAQGQQLVRPVYNALRAKDLDAYFTAGIRKQTPKAIDALKEAARGLEVEWMKDQTKPHYLTPEAAERVWKDSGGVGPVKDLFNKQALAQEPFTQTITHEWHPNGYATETTKIGNKDVYMHGEFKRQLETLKKLGTDTGQFGNFLRLKAPFIPWMMQAWKKNATFRGPQYFAFQLRNQIGDATRMYMFDGLDKMSPQEFAKTFALDSRSKLNGKGGRAAEYLKSEDPATFADTEFYFGETEGWVNGAEAIKRMQDAGLDLTGGQMQFEIMSKKPQGLVDNSYAGMASRASPNVVKPVVDFIDNAAEGLARWGGARELTNRIIMFNALKRAGRTDMAAAIQTNRALIQFNRMSEAGHMMRDSVMPFASYHMKAYPLLLQYAIENPGRFLNQLRAFEELRQKSDVDDKLLGDWMKGKATYVARKQNTSEGEIYSMGARSGMFPHDDFLEFMRQPGNKAKELIPIFQLMSDTQDALSKDDIWKSDTERWSRVAEDVAGRPAQTYRTLMKETDPRTGTGKSWWDKTKDFFSPSKTTDVNMTEARKRYTGKTDNDLKGAQTALAKAKGRLIRAEAQGKTDLREYKSQIQHAEQVLERAREEFARKPDVLK
jgi:hypothetical protein